MTLGGLVRCLVLLHYLSTYPALVDEQTQDLVHTARRLRNDQVHATGLSYFNPAIAARVIGTSHKLVAELFESDGKHLD